MHESRPTLGLRARALRVVFSITLIVGASVAAAFSGASIAADAITVPIAAKYSSPEEVFKAQREAYAKRDWRTVFDCNTLESKKLLIFEVFSHCTAAPEFQDLAKKYGADEERITAEYLKRYQMKYGAEPAAGTPRLDVSLFADVLWSQVQRPGALFAEWSDEIEAGDRYRPTSRLEDLKTTGDSATATTQLTVFVVREEEGKGTTRDEEVVEEVIRFRKNATGGWLIDAAYE